MLINFTIFNIKTKYFGYAGVTLSIFILLGYLALIYTGIISMVFPTSLIIQISLIVIWISLGADSGRDRMVNFSKEFLDKNNSFIFPFKQPEYSDVYSAILGSTLNYNVDYKIKRVIRNYFMYIQ